MHTHPVWLIPHFVSQLKLLFKLIFRNAHLSVDPFAEEGSNLKPAVLASKVNRRKRGPLNLYYSTFLQKFGVDADMFPPASPDVIASMVSYLVKPESYQVNGKSVHTQYLNIAITARLQAKQCPLMEGFIWAEGPILIVYYSKKIDKIFQKCIR